MPGLFCHQNRTFYQYEIQVCEIIVREKHFFTRRIEVQITAITRSMKTYIIKHLAL